MKNTYKDYNFDVVGKKNKLTIQPKLFELKGILREKKW